MRVKFGQWLLHRALDLLDGQWLWISLGKPPQKNRPRMVFVHGRRFWGPLEY